MVEDIFARVQGSLDAPPIVVTSATWKTVLALFGAISFVVIGAVLLQGGDPQMFVFGILGIGFFGLGGMVLAIRLVRPVVLQVGPDGIATAGGWRNVRLAWSDIGAFALVRMRSTVFLGFDVSPGFAGKLPLSAANRALAGIDGALPAGLTLSPRDLAVLVNAAAAKWAPAPIPFTDRT
jgi:hypothetical protein